MKNNFSGFLSIVLLFPFLQNVTIGFSITEYISNLGYPVEEHVNIETEDGYLLDMQRIPRGRDDEDTTEKRPVVLLMHGVLGSAENWIVLGAKKGLPFLLADQGYDVWMGNARGTLHSRKHTHLKPDGDDRFWQFSWHEIGVYDLPAKIDYILEETNQTQLYYVGHSQGTTAFFVMASERPEYNQNIKLMMALAPVAFMSNFPHPAIQVLARFERGLTALTGIIGLNEFLPTNNILSLAGQALCQERAVIQELCANILFLIAGYDSEQLDRATLPILLATSPAGSSMKQFSHYGQEISTDNIFNTACKMFNKGIVEPIFRMFAGSCRISPGKFQQFDYGYLENLERYGQTEPPQYDLSKVTAPVALFYANNDWLVSEKDVEHLAALLPNVVLKYLVPLQSFNHLDFILAKDIVPLVYSKMFELMKKQ
ncbi:lipase 3 isoform X2 [Aethina tumida]|uniref:lipase 3 isoform X2 n=1 Tax=Aethina tumida TaxID=116153 RepID=UPI00096B3122|nr:lipase 3 isoform X2 [Aethina tumida]